MVDETSANSSMIVDRQEALDLYHSMKAGELAWIGLYRQTTFGFLTLTIATLGATVSGHIASSADNEMRLVIAVAGPLVNVLLCVTAMQITNRYYRRFLECITVMSKLEDELGLNRRGFLSTGSQNAKVFPEDTTLLPHRWADDKVGYDTSQEFIDVKAGGGINVLTQGLFWLIVGINIVVGALLLWQTSY